MSSNPQMEKPLGRKAYGSIGHLPQSRLGPGDHCVTEGQARICCEKARDKHDAIYVQEKLDGSCCAVAKVNGVVVALGRAGWLAQSSPYEQHRLFAMWVRERYSRFDTLLREGERVVGEWLAQAHGTRYELKHEPFVVFDIMRDTERAIVEEVVTRVMPLDFNVPHMLGSGPMSIETAMALLDPAAHGALDPIEGAVWRVERKGKVDFLAKYVRPDKIDGCYLPERGSNTNIIWNWRP